MSTIVSFPISGFTAVPNPMMLSFLATQGFAIMYYGGAGWQFGKRKVSGMSNEQVNAMSPNEFLMKLHSETKTMVPTMSQGMKDMTPLIHTTMTQFGAYIREAIKAIPETVGNIFSQSYQGADNPYGNLSSVRYAPQVLQQQRLQVDPALFQGTQDQWNKFWADAGYVKTPPYQGTGKGGVGQSEVAVIAQEKLRLKLLKRKKQVFAKEFVKIKQPIPQIRKTSYVTPTHKRRAGQSQIMERDRLIKYISAMSKNVRFVSFGRNINPKTLTSEKRARSIRKAQQMLVNLLARYRF